MKFIDQGLGVSEIGARGARQGEGGLRCLFIEKRWEKSM